MAIGAMSGGRRYDARVFDPRDRRSPMSRLSPLAVLGLVAAIALAACGSGVGTSAPSGAAASASPAAEASASSPASASAASTPEAGQTDTEWGRIWDSLPSGFPSYPGSTPADEASTGPASATLAVDGDVAKAISTSMATQLENASYRTVDLSGPFEDGSYVLQSTGPVAGCRVQVTAVPLGSLTTVTILYGAACPHD